MNCKCIILEEKSNLFAELKCRYIADEEVGGEMYTL